MNQEAEYWDSHSPLDLSAEAKAQKVCVRGVKDRPITVRLDSESRSKFDRLAAEQGLGPSSFARLILTSVIERNRITLVGRIYDPVLDCGHFSMNIEEPEEYRVGDIQSVIRWGFADKRVRLTIEEIGENMSKEEK